MEENRPAAAAAAAAPVPASDRPTLNDLRSAIPKHCFEPVQWISAAYIVRDLTFAGILLLLSFQIPSVESTPLRWALWTLYGFVQGLVFTGIWILAHECGHRALFRSDKVNSTMGFFLHSLLGVPFFSWKFSHARHHRYTNHLEKDTAFVPCRKEDVSFTSKIAAMLPLEHAEDMPAMTLLSLIAHQLLGWPMYLLWYVSAGPNSKPQVGDGNSFTDSHFNPLSGVFTANEQFYVLMSDLGLLATASALVKLSAVVGTNTTLLAYGLPYLWVNHWIVAITYLHHTHPKSLHFEASTWNFYDGALNTVDRDIGFIGKHFFHNIVEHHVVHHLFSRIPFYRAEEATEAIKPLLKENYMRDETNFMKSLWQTFSTCKYVEQSKDCKGVMTWASSVDPTR